MGGRVKVECDTTDCLSSTTAMHKPQEMETDEAISQLLGDHKLILWATWMYRTFRHSILKEDALGYISAYIIEHWEYQCQESSSTSVHQVLKGYLKKPDNAFVEKLKTLEENFHKINGLELSYHKNIFKTDWGK